MLDGAKLSPRRGGLQGLCRATGTCDDFRAVWLRWRAGGETLLPPENRKSESGKLEDRQEVSAQRPNSPNRDFRQTAELVGARLSKIRPEVVASLWRPAILSLYRFVALMKI